MGKIDGIIRDKKTGIVTARRDRHPLADLLRAIPSGAGNVAFTMPPELQHVIAIHLFDNLDCSPPRNPKYEYVEAGEGIRGGMNQGGWEPPTAGNPAKVIADPVMIPDPEGWSKERIAAMQQALRNEEIRQKLIAGTDPVADPDANSGPNPTAAGEGSDLQ